MTFKPLLTPEQVAGLLQISLKTVYKKARAWGGFSPGGLKVLRFPPGVIYELLEGGGQGLAVSVQTREEEIQRRFLSDKGRGPSGGSRAQVENRSERGDPHRHGL